MNSITAGAWVFSIALSAFAQAPSPKGVNFYSLSDEVRLGQLEAANLARALPLVHEAKLDGYIAKLGSELARHAGPQFAYSFTIYEDRKPLAVLPVRLAMPADAFQTQATEPVALPGGPILVPLSLLAGAHNEAELAFQLAHAIAHIALRHSTKEATLEELVDMGNTWVHVQNAAAGRIIAANQELAMRLGLLNLARRYELHADTVATGIVAAAGYDPEAALPFPGQPTTGRTQMSRVFSAHPAGARRLEAVRVAREALPSRIYSAGRGEFDEIKAIAATVR